ncbi:hypothetical protein BN1012_Phect1037 [Candidatus Phaeomarinobacter ectocarpi]|uniref:Uncharacterized protein n=1 Tax=Candidatus Phaeomarinibacter ectocarpi TaxID=1458461 RepID=X5MMJ1_9HYPH|nr:hypothetical protein BN1012_Phect1037 [Candidatus Phaeomarinobacter ectocarpi]
MEAVSEIAKLVRELRFWMPRFGRSAFGADSLGRERKTKQTR